MTPPPIRIPCEGSGADGHPWGAGVCLCPMCGQIKAAATGKMPAHDRDDILAMLDRGDYYGKANR